MKARLQLPSRTTSPRHRFLIAAVLLFALIVLAFVTVDLDHHATAVDRLTIALSASAFAFSALAIFASLALDQVRDDITEARVRRIERLLTRIADATEGAHHPPPGDH